MNLKNIYTSNYQQVVRAIFIDNPISGRNDSISFGHFIDQKISASTALLTVNAQGYKIEDDGVLAGYYVVDYTVQGFPYLALWGVRAVYGETERTNIFQTIQQWLTQEYGIRATA